MAQGSGNDQEMTPGGSALGTFVHRARTVALPALSWGRDLAAPLASTAQDCPPDVEMGEREPRWSHWARQAQHGLSQSFDRAKSVDWGEQARQVQNGLSNGLDRAKSVDWGEQAEGVRNSVSRGLSNVAEGASSATTSIQDRVSQGVDRARSIEWSEQARGLQQGVSRSFETAAASASSAGSSLQERLSDSQGGTPRAFVQKTRESASAAAEAAGGALSVARDRVSGAATLAMSPRKLMQFAAVFLTGAFIIILSLNFLPILIIAPGKFALFFTLGSTTMLSSFVILKGPRSFAEHLTQRKKLPFSSAYIVSLIGTLWATLIKRSLIFTAIFAIIQSLALLYFVASYFPFGTTTLNAIGRSARSFILR